MLYENTVFVVLFSLFFLLCLSADDHHALLTPTSGYLSKSQSHLLTGGRVMKCPGKRVV